MYGFAKMRQGRGRCTTDNSEVLLHFSFFFLIFFRLSLMLYLQRATGVKTHIHPPTSFSFFFLCIFLHTAVILLIQLRAMMDFFATKSAAVLPLTYSMFFFGFMNLMCWFSKKPSWLWTLYSHILVKFRYCVPLFFLHSLCFCSPSCSTREHTTDVTDRCFRALWQDSLFSSLLSLSSSYFFIIT